MLGAILIHNGKVIQYLNDKKMKTRRIVSNFIKNKIIFFVFSMMFILGSCDKESNKNQSKTLIGKWSWIQSNGGFGGVTNTPQSTGDVITIEFVNNSVYRQYRNGILSIETTYELKNVEGHSELFIFYGNGHASIITLLDIDKLILTDYMCDGYVNTYRKK